MYKDIDNYIKSCIVCAQYNPRRQKPPNTLRPIKPSEAVWQLVAMDFHGPITPTSQRGNKYIIFLTDVLSKFVVTKAVRFLKEDVITKFGTPRCILLTVKITSFLAVVATHFPSKIGQKIVLLVPSADEHKFFCLTILIV
jgi:hypothetical protein